MLDYVNSAVGMMLCSSLHAFERSIANVVSWPYYQHMKIDLNQTKSPCFDGIKLELNIANQDDFWSRFILLFSSTASEIVHDERWREKVYNFRIGKEVTRCSYIMCKSMSSEKKKSVCE